MATYVSHRLIIGKVSAVSLEISDFFLTDMFTARFICLLSKPLNLIGCRGDMKGTFLKNIKVFFSVTIRG